MIDHKKTSSAEADDVSYLSFVLRVSSRAAPHDSGGYVIRIHDVNADTTAHFVEKSDAFSFISDAIDHITSSLH